MTLGIDRKDIVRTMLIASSIFMIISAFYAVFIHSRYTGQINNIRTNLIQINKWYQGKAEKTHGMQALEYKKIAREAEDISKNITGPRLNPYAYVYLNYWISSAAFTQLLLTYRDLGLDNETSAALQKLDEMGWYGNRSFYIFDLAKGKFVQKLARKPEPKAYPWTYYIFVFITAMAGTWIGVRKRYETHVIPEVICATASLLPFWGVYIVGTLIAILIGAIRPETVSFGAYAVAFIVTLIISALAGAIAGIIRERREAQ